MAQESETVENSVNVSRQARPVRELDLPLAEIEAAVRGVRYGVVQIIIQDGVVIQIDRTDKRRLR
jgi:hypothetical protein